MSVLDEGGLQPQTVTTADEIRGDRTRFASLAAGTHRTVLGATGTVEPRKVEAAIRFLEVHEDLLDADQVAELRALIARHEQ